VTQNKSKLEDKRYLIITIIAAIVIVSVVTAIRFSDTSSSPIQENVTYNSYAVQIITDCEDDAECAVNALRDMAKREDRNTVLATFKEILYTYDEYRFACHKTAHHLGIFLYDYIGDLSETLSHAEQQCGGAAIHGIMQGYFAEQLAKGMSKEDIGIANLCPEIEGHPYAIERWQCIHGIGHGLTISYEYDVFSAVQRCEVFEPGWEQTSCSKGLFMENMVANLRKEVRTLEEGDLLFPCNVVDAKYAPACYHYQTGHIFSQSSANLTEGFEVITRSFEVCNEISPNEFVKYCYYGMGRVLQSGVGLNYERALAFCQKGQSDYWSDCFKGMVMTHVNRDRNTDFGFAFCKFLPEEFKVDCYDAMGKWALMLHPTSDGIAEECSKAESLDYFEICMKASLEDITLL